MKFIITKANSDTDGRIINKLIEEYASRNKERILVVSSLGQLRYLSAMKYSSVIIGNSSSGIIETPSFKVPTVNIGSRQKGRIKARSVIDCEVKKDEIILAINKALDLKFLQSIKDIENPYGDGESSEKIIVNLKKCINNRIDLKKEFYNL